MANLGHVFTGRCGGMRVSLLISFPSRPDVSQGWTRSHAGLLSVLRQSTTLTWQRKPACLGEQTEVSTSTCIPPRRHAGHPSLLAEARSSIFGLYLEGSFGCTKTRVLMSHDSKRQALVPSRWAVLQGLGEERCRGRWRAMVLSVGQKYMPSLLNLPLAGREQSLSLPLPTLRLQQ